MWFRSELLFYQVGARIRSQIVKSYFGPLWWVLEPLLTMLAYYLVFELLLARGGPNYVFVLLVGVSVWGWFSNVIMQSSQSMMRSAHVMQQVNVSKLLFPLIDILDVGFKHLFVLMVLLTIVGSFMGPNMSWLMLPIIVLEALLLGAAFGFLFSALTPFFPDLQQLLSMFMRVLMFCSGVFYSLEAIRGSLRDYFLLNPFANIINQFRTVLLEGQIPDLLHIAIISASSIALLVCVIKFIRANETLYPRLAIQ